MGLAGWWGRHRVARAVGMLLVVPALGGGLLGLLLLGAGASVKVTNSSATSGSVGTVAPRLEPIVIPVRACPYLDAVHAAGMAARSAPGGSSCPELRTLELALRVAAPQAPEPLRLKLEEAADAAGEFAAFTPSKGVPPDFYAALSGIGAVDDANHLVGTACGFEPNLRPMLWWP